MWLGKFLADLLQGAADLRKPQIIYLAHRGEGVTLEEIQERQTRRIRLRRDNDRSLLTEPRKPVAQSCVRNFEVDRGFRQAISRLFVKSVVRGGHYGDTVNIPS